ncbi:nucleotide exchange factor GrpE [Mycoplasmopsis primatum]|uniref:nucleotide exchange factor GrpE n=1 Tax=Mycoplasmopsis primatum TaxID=55604 RepID=UPI0006900F91|nr:nucleotide exchange factor GrpE [Mycoplasmopsis primatum]
MNSKFNNIILEQGDKLILDIHVYTNNGGMSKELSKNNFALVLGQNSFIPDFDENFIGRNLEDTYDFVISFDKKYPLEKYRNQDIRFLIDVKDYISKSQSDLETKIISLQNEVSEIKKDYQEQSQVIELTKNEAKNAHNSLMMVQKQKDELEKKLLNSKTNKQTAPNNDSATPTNSAEIEKLNQENKELNEQIKVLKEEIQKAKAAPKALTIPKELKKEVEQYALQKFFEEFVAYYKFYKVTSERVDKEAEILDDPKLKAFSKGYRMITWQFDELLKKYGLVEIKPTEGETFDPSYQKVNEQFIDDKLPTNTIINIHSPAFKLHDRVLQVALVDTTVQSSDPQAKRIIEEDGDDAYHKTPGVIHTLEEKIRSSMKIKEESKTVDKAKKTTATATDEDKPKKVSAKTKAVERAKAAASKNLK